MIWTNLYIKNKAILTNIKIIIKLVKDILVIKN
jgi:hypothetical protein